MKLRSRRLLSVPKQRTTNQSHTQRRPVLLPSIYDRHGEYDDEIQVSPEYKQIKSKDNTYHEISSSQLSIARKPSASPPPHSYHRLHKMLKPNIVARCAESISLYQSIKQRIKQQMSDRYLQEQREGMEIIHDRLMKIL